MARLAPWAVLGLLGLATAGFFGPQHKVKSTQIVICFAPDCRSSAYRTTSTCGGTAWLGKELFPDILNPMIFGALFILQILALVLRRRTLHLAAGIVTLLGAVVVMGVLGYHSVIGHLLTKTVSQWGEVTTGLAAIGLFFVGFTQLILAATFASTRAVRKPVAI